MPVEPQLNAILNQMWLIDEKIATGESLSKEEKDFYNTNLNTIIEYYKNNNEYWNIKEKII